MNIKKPGVNQNIGIVGDDGIDIREDEDGLGGGDKTNDNDNEALDSDGSTICPSSTNHHKANSQMSETNQSLSNSNSQLRKGVSTSAHNVTTTTNLSHVSHLSQSTQNSSLETITQFFYYEPGLSYHPPPPHELKDSPCKSIIRSR